MLDAALDLVTRENTEQAADVLDKALARTRVTIGELRDLSFNLEPVVLRDHGFGTAVNALLQDRGMEHGIQVEIDTALAEALGERAQAALYQIVREALEGAIRRGPPRTFSVRVTQAKPDTLEATISDDAPGERRRRSIEVLEERARTLGASLSVEQTDTGTTMRLALPDLRGRRVGSAPGWAATTSSSSGGRPATSCTSARATSPPSATRSRRTA